MLACLSSTRAVYKPRRYSCTARADTHANGSSVVFRSLTNIMYNILRNIILCIYVPITRTFAQTATSRETRRKKKTKRK